MGYLDKVRLAGETLAYEPAFSRMAQYGAPTLEFIVVAGLWSLGRAIFVDPVIDAQTPDTQAVLRGAYLIGLAVFAGRFAWRMAVRFVHLQFRELAITDRRFMEKEGVLNVRFWSTDLEKIVRVVIEQSWLGRMFNYGAVTIVTVGEVSHTTTAVSDPISLQQALHARMHADDPSPPQAVTPPPPLSAERI